MLVLKSQKQKLPSTTPLYDSFTKSMADFDAGTKFSKTKKNTRLYLFLYTDY
jgi:hypothetical protein